MSATQTDRCGHSACSQNFIDTGNVECVTVKVESVQLIGRRWFSRGNTYHSCVIHVNGDQVHRIDFAYGGGSMFEQNAAEWLVKNGFLPLESRKSGGYEPLWQASSRLNFKLNSDVIDVPRKKDL